MVKTMSFNRPTTMEQSDFLYSCLLGSSTDKLRGCVDLAYRDMCRTLRRFASHPDKDHIKDESYRHVYEAIHTLPRLVMIDSRSSYDAWHRLQCDTLRTIFHQPSGSSKIGFTLFQAGQAQKWLNMTLKYVYMCGENHLPGYERFFDYAHAPIDSLLLKGLREHCTGRARPESSTALGCKTAWPDLPWSQLEYEDYLELQNRIRVTFDGSAPLSVEFHLYNLIAYPSTSGQ